MHRYFKHIEDVHVTFAHKNVIVDFEISDFGLQYRLNVMDGHGWGWGRRYGLAEGTGASHVPYRHNFLV